MTTYLILEDEGNEQWSVSDKPPVEASSAKAAIRKHLGGTQVGGTFVAIPARSWQPVKVQVETALKFST